MKLTLFGLIAVSCLAGSARAQALGRVQININNPQWVVVQDLNQFSSSQFVSVPGSGTDVLNVNAFVDVGNSASVLNSSQSNVSGVRTGPIPLSASASANISAPGGFMQIAWTGAGNRTVSVSGQVSSAGVLPAHQSINMTGNSSMTINYGILATSNIDTRTSTAAVVPPSCSGKICAVYNRLILNQSAPINNPPFTATPAFPTFFYSQQGSASASCTLNVGQTAMENTDVRTDFTATLN